MRRISFIALLVAAIVVSVLAGGCTRNVTAVSIEGKWTLQSAIGSYTVNGVNRKDTSNYNSTAYYWEINNDGTLKIVEKTGVFNGNWKLVNNKLFITNTGFIDFPNGFDVSTLNSNLLQLYYTETTVSTFSEQKLIMIR
jgi:hypothetical protein